MDLRQGVDFGITLERIKVVVKNQPKQCYQKQKKIKAKTKK